MSKEEEKEIGNLVIMPPLLYCSFSEKIIGVYDSELKLLAIMTDNSINISNNVCEWDSSCLNTNCKYNHHDWSKDRKLTPQEFLQAQKNAERLTKELFTVDNPLKLKKELKEVIMYEI